MLKIFINGRRFIPRGGNWGFPESMLRYRAREYDIAVRYHRDMNFTMIRNWWDRSATTPSTTPATATASSCGRILARQPRRRSDPDDNDLFLRNVSDTILRIRNHPQWPLLRTQRRLPAQAAGRGHPKTAGRSAPRVALHLQFRRRRRQRPRSLPRHAAEVYFDRPPVKFHSEMGMPNIPRSRV